MDNTPPDTNTPPNTKSFSRPARMEDFFDETDVPNEKNNKNNKNNKDNRNNERIKKNQEEHGHKKRIKP
jgi:hypothetical protein